MIQPAKLALNWMGRMNVRIGEHPTKQGVDQGTAVRSPMGQFILLGEGYTSESTLAIVLFHEIGHLAQTTYWNRRTELTKKRPDDSVWPLEEELAWLAGEIMLKHAGMRLPMGWRKIRDFSLSTYYRAKGYASLEEGRLWEGMDEAFFARARRDMLRNKTFQSWLNAVPTWAQKVDVAA